MTTEQAIASKSKAHTIYKLKDGTRVPGVTTITGVMDKPALVKWANNLGLQGIDSTKYVDATARIGTLAHKIIECYLTDEEPDFSDSSENEIACAKKCADKFFQWEKSRGLTKSDYALSESPLVSEKYRFGGTVDICAVVNGAATLIDLKTCKGIYGEHKTQIAGGYSILLNENGFALDSVLILRIGRDESEGFEEITVSKDEIALHIKRFLICKELYEINKQIK